MNVLIDANGVFDVVEKHQFPTSRQRVSQFNAAFRVGGLFGYKPGQQPIVWQKLWLKWLRLEYPTSSAASVTLYLPLWSSSAARSMRSLRRH